MAVVLLTPLKRNCSKFNRVKELNQSCVKLTEIRRQELTAFSRFSRNNFGLNIAAEKKRITRKLPSTKRCTSTLPRIDTVKRRCLQEKTP